MKIRTICLLSAWGMGLLASIGINPLPKLDDRFPAHELPSLEPRPGYKIAGYMGCPLSSKKAIEKMERRLFFAEDPSAAQRYAIWRTPFIGEDVPVVLQIEIREDDEITREDLWRDPHLNASMLSPVPVQVDYWPAIPPEVQKRVDLHVRVHHVVTCELRQADGGLCRGAKSYRKLLKDRLGWDIFEKKESAEVMT